MSDGPDEFTLRLMFNTGVSEGEANDLILQSQQVTADDVWRVRDFGVLAVIDLTADGEVEAPVREAARNALWDSGIRHVHVPVTGPDDIADACSVMLNEVRLASSPAQSVLVHCQMGSDRSVCVATAVKAVRTGQSFAEQLTEVHHEFPGIAVSRSMAEAADTWVQQMTDRLANDLAPDPVMQCPRCRSEITAGGCEAGHCDHTVCPFCGDGRGAEKDGCPHLVLSLVGMQDHRRGGQALRWYIAGDIRLMSAPLPYLVEATDARGAEALMADIFGTYPNPWPNGITEPPARADLLTMAAALGNAMVRGNATDDWDENMDHFMVPVVRAYAIDIDGVVGRALEVLRDAGTQLEEFGTVGWAEF